MYKDKDGGVHVSTEEGRAGRTPHIVRYVLVISLVLAIIAMAWTMFDKSGDVDGSLSNIPSGNVDGVSQTPPDGTPR